ncbi:hypothetical protein Vi05172_g9471 [Venturia inaequalis]|nr:hypothetical protein Vi05172_g9471 [Venturia inaequalis]
MLRCVASDVWACGPSLITQSSTTQSHQAKGSAPGRVRCA